MKKFDVVIKETFESPVEIEAETEEEALLKAKHAYDMEEIVLDYTALVDTDFEILDQELLEAESLINVFCFNEYYEEADFTDLTRVGLAYTTTEDEEHEIQVNVDLINFKLIQLVDNKVIKTCNYNSLRELIDNELKNLSFDELVSID